MSALICGSVAYDTIMVFPDQFSRHILPERIHILNVSFMVPKLRREFGGCAGNIAYNMTLLGGDGIPMATVGTDFAPYAQWMETHSIDMSRIKPIKNSYTAQAFITTDMDDNQITAFHPGAMSFSHENRVTDTRGVTIGIIAPDGRDGMIEHARQFADAGIPFMFDPGQGLPMFNGDDLLAFIDKASWVAVNDYEAQVLEQRTGLSAHELAERVDALIVTLGAKGSQIYTEGHRIDIPAATPIAQVDPTGCGDAYRAGLLYGLMNKMDWETTGRIASMMGAIKIENPGTQNHRFTRAEFEDRFEENFGQRL
ncbi:MAG: adenosine kinase [Gammaproteobacteria bacterium]|nr:MAG: adenosine kinase [Gammaproteobacteria bacterium]TND04010.1 MAG: adenosine kinase [Gammaproteobacteria bacterium]